MDRPNGLTDLEKSILIRFFIAQMRLSRAKKDNTVKQYSAQMADAISDFVKEISK